MAQPEDAVTFLRALQHIHSDLLPSTNPLTLYQSIRTLSLFASDRTDENALPGCALPLQPTLAAVSAAAWAVKYAAACYGVRGKLFYDLMATRSSVSGLLQSFAGDQRAFLATAGLPEGTAVRVEGGRPGFPKCFLCVDREAGAVVLAIRGTLSLADVATDACAYEVDFCGGRSHAGLASSARSVWSVLEQGALQLLSQHPTFALVLTGHSLGGAAAQLLAILLHYERAHAEARGRRTPLSGRAIACWAFASPPCFSPPSLLPPALAACLHNWVHRGDAVARLSATSIKELCRVAEACGAENRVGVLTPLTSLFATPSVITTRTLAAEPQWARAWGCGGEGSSGGAAAAAAAAEGGGGVGGAAAAATAAAAAAPLELPGRVYVYRYPALSHAPAAVAAASSSGSSQSSQSFVHVDMPGSPPLSSSSSSSSSSAVQGSDGDAAVAMDSTLEEWTCVEASAASGSSSSSSQASASAAAVSASAAVPAAAAWPASPTTAPPCPPFSPPLLLLTAAQPPPPSPSSTLAALASSLFSTVGGALGSGLAAVGSLLPGGSSEAGGRWCDIGVQGDMLRVGAGSRVRYGGGGVWVERHFAEAAHFQATSDFFGGGGGGGGGGDGSDPRQHAPKRVQRLLLHSRVSSSSGAAGLQLALVTECHAWDMRCIPLTPHAWQDHLPHHYFLGLERLLLCLCEQQREAACAGMSETV